MTPPTHRLPADELARLVQSVRSRTLALVGDLDRSQLDFPYQATVNPFRWELGHVSQFYDAMLLRQLGIHETFVENADDMYDSFRVEHTTRWTLPLPDLDGTLGYLDATRARVTDRLSDTPTAHETYLYLLAVYHEDMHDEAFTYTRQTLGYAAPSLPGALPGPTAGAGGPCPGDVEVPGGTWQLGTTPDAPFCFDNERWAHPVELEPFSIARATVTNQRFAAFVDDGGYGRRDLWDREGWLWRQGTGAEHPLYWRRAGDGWGAVHFDRTAPLAPHAPVSHVSWYEAQAWCRWAGRRLPTEAQWEAAASGERDTAGDRLSARKRRYPWGDEPPTPERTNSDGLRGGCIDVGALPAGDSAFGCRQVMGNVWEWTEDAFYPFPGYLVDRPYREYSAPWFGDRKVLRGGSWAASHRLSYNTYRNFFTPDRTAVPTGFRTCPG